jgi:hypothetical protein
MKRTIPLGCFEVQFITGPTDSLKLPDQPWIQGLPHGCITTWCRMRDVPTDRFINEFFITCDGELMDLLQFLDRATAIAKKKGII